MTPMAAVQVPCNRQALHHVVLMASPEQGTVYSVPCDNYVLQSICSYWTTAPRRNTKLGSWEPLLTFSSMDQHKKLACVFLFQDTLFNIFWFANIELIGSSPITHALTKFTNHTRLFPESCHSLLALRNTRESTSALLKGSQLEQGDHWQKAQRMQKMRQQIEGKEDTCM